MLARSFRTKYLPNQAADLVVYGPTQLWVADITNVAITAGFVYVAVILDAWSCRVVGYALSPSIDVRLMVAALKAAMASAPTAPGCDNSVRFSA